MPLFPDEPQHLARLYSSWSVALKLTNVEATEAFERAVELLSEDYPNLSDGELRGRTYKAHQLAKVGMPGTLQNLSVFISRCRQPSLSAV